MEGDIQSGPLDLAIIGGGVNGAAIARDAAGRGLKVALVEMGDIGGATSSASSKLIHGGLRYLENYEFRMVGQALAEREVLLRAAPHLVRPLEFILPHGAGQRPAWMIRAGLFLYDHLARRATLPGSRRLHLRPGGPLREAVTTGFSYADCLADDSRLTLANAQDAAERGALILPRTKCVSASRDAEGWALELAGPRARPLRARLLVNAAGPWAGTVMHEKLGLPATARVRLVKGSHLVLPRLYEGAHAYILQNDDGRVVFVIPWQDRFSLVGTTDVEFEGDPAGVRAEPAEIEYLLDAVGKWFAARPRAEDVVWRYAGVRPLHDDGAGKASRVTRDHVLLLDQAAAPVLSVVGGKLTGHRHLAQEAMEKIAPLLGCHRPAWTHDAILPGGDIHGGDFEGFAAELAEHLDFLPAGVARRWARQFGTRAALIAQGPEALGAHLGDGLYEAELDYLARAEWASTANDVLWRRTKLGLLASPETEGAVAAWLAQDLRQKEPA